MARKKGDRLVRGHPRLRLVLLAALFVLMLFPRASAPAVASQRASGEIVAREVVQHDPTRNAGGLTVRTESGTELGLKDAGATGGGRLRFTSDPVDAGQAFDPRGVHWIAALGSEDTFYVEVRTSRDGASWSEWAVFTADEDMADRDRNEWFAGPYAVPAARFAQYRVWLTGGDAGALEQVALSFMDVSDLNAGPIARLASDLLGALSDSGRSYAEAAPAGASAIRSRQDWAADENLMLWAPKYQPVPKVIIHHTVTDDGGTNPAAPIRSIYYYHAVTPGWRGGPARPPCPGSGIYNSPVGLPGLAQAGVANGSTPVPNFDAQLGKPGAPGTRIPVSVSVTTRGVPPSPAGTVVSYKLLSKG